MKMPAAPQQFDRSCKVFFLGCLLALVASEAPAAEARHFQLGVAKVDVTPAEPIRLTGYGGRRTNSIGIEQKLWAKALAIGSEREGPALLMTLDNCGIAEETYRELVRRLKKAGVKQERLAICLSHTHTGPCTTHWAPNIFSQDIVPEEQATIDRYTRELIDKLEQVALAALKDRRPGKLSWSQGRVGFARNRRVVAGKTAQFGDNAAGPVDHALPTLKVEDLDGKLRALVANYACHCTTLGGEFNQICGDWAGYAQEYLERDHPGAVALITIGCGADANPHPRGGADAGLALAKQHGKELASEVRRLLSQNFTPLSAKLSTRLKEIQLPFGPHFTREQWEARAKERGIVGYHARKWLARLDQGQKLPASLYYPIGAWNFGEELALVFLPGEVVVDYALRLKKEFDASRLWVTAYANYVPCYIPSRRILAEGGYEAEGSLWYYDRPARISTNAEELIIRSLHNVLPKSFLFDSKKAEFPSPKTPEQALATFRTRAELMVELVAAEPLIESPVALDWSADGRLWVCEMFDYPTGVDGKYKPGGRIKVLQATRGDGRYNQATLFLDGLPFPTGVMPWRKGALICAAPNILYAEDTDGDGKADLVRTNFAGFATHNYQARVNGFTWGLDGWLHGSSGLFGGKVKSLLTGREVDLSGRDFRFRPDTGEIQPVAGLSQMGRVRDDFGQWFGNDNGTLLWHYPLPDHYIRRNPHVTYPDPRVLVSKGADANNLFPASRTLERFNDPQMANRTTSACGPEIYRDVLLGTNYYGNAFICEPVHNLVTRRVLAPDGVTFAAHRASDEQRSEFLASTDNWFRPVQVRTGPDGALWIVDMYRFVVEHPRWIPSNRLAQLDVRAGADKGRIYRVYPRGVKPRQIRDLKAIPIEAVVDAMGSSNGPQRDLAHRELVERFGPKTNWHSVRASVWERWHDIEHNHPHLAARVQAVAARKGIGSHFEDIPLAAMLLNEEVEMRRLAALIAETHRPDVAKNGRSGIVCEALCAMSRDQSPKLRFQAGLALGKFDSADAGEALSELLRGNLHDTWIRSAVLTSAKSHAATLLFGMASVPPETPGWREAKDALVSTALASPRKEDRLAALSAVMPTGDTLSAPQLLSLGKFLDALRKQERTEGATLSLEADQALARVRSMAGRVRALAVGSETDESLRVAAVALLGQLALTSKEDLTVIASFLRPDTPARVRNAALDGLRLQQGSDVPELLLHDWSAQSPSSRAQIIALHMERERWMVALLDAVEKGIVALPEITPAQQQQLLRHSNPGIRDRAAKLFAAGKLSNRRDVLANYRDVNKLPGKVPAGSAVFEKNCAQCHAFRGRGHAVGANLGEFVGKSVDDFVQAIFDPNAAINPNFIAYNVETKDGRSLNGIVKGETGSGLTLVQGGGVEEKILRGDIKEIRASQLSLMPEGLEQSMTPQDVADLIAWLKSSGPKPFGSATGTQAAKARAEFLQGGINGLAALLTSGGELSYASWLGRLPMAYCRQDGGMNRLAWKTAPVPKGLSANATYTFRLAGGMGFASQPSGKFTLRLHGQTMFDFNVALSDQTWQSADGRVRMSYTVMENNAEDSNGVLVIEAPGGMLKPGESAQFEVIGSGAQSQRWFGIYLLTNQTHAALEGK